MDTNNNHSKTNKNNHSLLTMLFFDNEENYKSLNIPYIKMLLSNYESINKGNYTSNVNNNIFNVCHNYLNKNMSLNLMEFNEQVSTNIREAFNIVERDLNLSLYEYEK